MRGSRAHANLRRVDETLNHLDPRAIQRQANRRAKTSESAGYLLTRTATTVAERLAPLAVQPATILDISADGGRCARLVTDRFRKATLVTAGPAAGTERKRRWFQRSPDIRPEAPPETLTQATDSVELALANLTLPWSSAPADLLRELARVLAKDAPITLATLGPDSFRELRSAWDAATGDSAGRIPVFPDMHDIGDALVRAGFAEPVLDVDRITIEFANVATLWSDLRAAGAGNVLAARRRGLATRAQLETVSRHLDPAGNGFSLSMELVYAHAFAPAGSGRRLDGDVHINPAAIGQRRR